LKQKSCLTELLVATLATILGGLILSWIPVTRNIVSSFFNAIGSFYHVAWDFLTSEGRFPWILIVILFSLAFPTLVKIVRRLIPKPKTEPEVYEPSQQDYVEDEFFGAIWRWVSERPAAFCPRCQTRLIYNLGYSHRGLGMTTSLYCETCERTIATLDGDREQVLGMVTRQIEKKINTGEWRQVLEKKRKHGEQTDHAHP
jgi:hypothetical protein